MKARITLGTRWAGSESETVEIEVEDEKEYDSDEFSTRILDALSNGEFPHYWIAYELVEEEKEDEEDV